MKIDSRKKFLEFVLETHMNFLEIFLDSRESFYNFLETRMNLLEFF
jgi:hypothetical protein